MQYDTDEPDDYYCEKCLVKVKEIAKAVDAKMAMRPKKEIISDLEQFNKVADKKGFASLKNLGI